MVHSKEDLKFRLSKEELDYRKEAAELGSESIHALHTLINEPDKLLASKAAYLVSLITGDDLKSINALKDAAQNESPEVRVAAAAGVRNIRSAAMRSRSMTSGSSGPNQVDKLIDEIADILEKDTDTGVQKQVRKLKSSSI